MNKTLIIAALLLSACESQEDRKAECHRVVDAVCSKAEECELQSADACYAVAFQEGICLGEVTRPVAELQKCQQDLALADCTTLPISCY